MPFAIAGLVVAWGVMLALGGMTLDRDLLLLGYAGDRPILAETARWLTELGGWAVLLPFTAAGAILLLARRDSHGALLLVAITLSGRLLVEVQKVGIGRLRPDANEHLVAVGGLSFPSGHAANSLMVWLCLALLVPRTGRGRTAAIWGAIGLTMAIGVTRVMLGVHWPSDVIGGWSFGLAWTLLLLRLTGIGTDSRVRPS